MRILSENKVKEVNFIRKVNGEQKKTYIVSSLPNSTDISSYGCCRNLGCCSNYGCCSNRN